jgi:hypothetical protein
LRKAESHTIGKNPSRRRSKKAAADSFCRRRDTDGQAAENDTIAFVSLHIDPQKVFSDMSVMLLLYR